MARWKIVSAAVVAVLLVILALGTVGHPAARSAGAGRTEHVKLSVVSSPPRRSAFSGGLAMWANYRLIPVWTEKGFPMYVNASVMPVLFFDVSDPRPAERVVAEMGRLSGPHPLALIAAGFPKESLGAAETRATKLGARAFRGEQVLLLQGPWATFSHSLPAFAYLGHSSASAVVVSAAKGVSLALLGRAEHETLAGARSVRVKPARKGSRK